VSYLKDEKLILKRQTYTKTEACNSILEYFEYFCQISSKSISIIWSYTVSKFARFFLRHSSTNTVGVTAPVDDLWATKSEAVKLIVRAISFPIFPTYVVLIHQRYRQTDGRTDGRHAIALQYSASRGKNQVA